MKNHIAQGLLTLLLPLLLFCTPAISAEDPPEDPIAQAIGLGNSLGLGQAADEFLLPDQAFQFSAEVRDANTISLNWVIAEGYYLYGDKFKIRLKDAQGILIKEVTFPPGTIKDDEFFGRMEVHHQDVEALVQLTRTDPQTEEIVIQASYQGCAEAGICYPPINKSAPLLLVAANTNTAPITPQESAPSITPPAQAVSEQDKIAQSLATGKIPLIILSFFGFGLLLAFTPCVFPMIPILSSILVGQGKDLTPRRGFGFALVYVLAMALTYTVAGILAGKFGQNIQAMFQNPWILSAFAIVFVLLALSMFGFYKLQIPGFIQTRLTQVSNQQQGGTLVGVAIMGFLSALIVGPCVAAPLAGALIYIGQTGDAVLGGLALFALSMGMGTPLLAIGAGAGKLLPKAGHWMDKVNAVFGVLLLALAIWLLERILPASITLALWATLFMVSSIYMGALDTVDTEATGWRRLWKGLGLLSLVYGVLLLIGAASGGKDLFQPLGGLGMLGSGKHTEVAESSPEFQTIKSVDDLKRELSLATKNTQYVMLDFYADWCVACKELEKYTFSDPQVQAALQDIQLLQADVTGYDEQDRALLKNLGLIGPPSILFFGPDGKERKNLRLVGFMKADQFLKHLTRLRSG